MCRRLLFDERTFDSAGNCVEDPLQMLIAHYADKKAASAMIGANPRHSAAIRQENPPAW